MADEFDNVYQAPTSNVDVSISGKADQIWRRASSVVVTAETLWPKRCIKCNTPTDKTLKRTLVYVNPWIYLSILVSILITLILALIFQKKFKMEIPVCEKHIAYRKRVILINWLLFLVVIAGVWITAADISQLGMVVSVLVLLVMTIFGLANRLAIVTKYKEPYIYVRGAKSRFLDSLNEFE
ncbi:MAG: hypothetical protein P8Z75_08060 [Gammaproteobacteria bacterium]